jgi:sulfatase maturation enzyme AslB (radical SAM superfamily)
MIWQCAAIDHGLTVFPNGKIGPCCQISPDYLKPLDAFNDPDRFSDLRTELPPAACEKCVKNEHEGLTSYRHFFNNYPAGEKKNVVFLDIRNTNLCNLKCRYCGPHFSNQWAKELNVPAALVHTDITDILDHVLTHDLRWIYFTGGEPLISTDHWGILSRLIDKGIANTIELMYNTNLTSLKFKDLDFADIWNKFAGVNLSISMDAIGRTFDCIRSGADWTVVEKNLDRLQSIKTGKIKLSVTCVISVLNIWSLPELIRYCQSRDINMQFIILEGPDYLAVDVIPDQLQDLALSKIQQCLLLLDDPLLRHCETLIMNNHNQVLFRQCVAHITLLDSVRGEHLFDQLPFRDISLEMIAHNHEYE